MALLGWRQVDSDIMVRAGWIGGPRHWPGPPDARGLLDDARRLFARDAAAVTWSLPICPAHVPDSPHTAYGGFTWSGSDGRPHRVEVRACFLHLPRLLAARPLPWQAQVPAAAATTTKGGTDAGRFCAGRGGAPPDAWYRLLDAAILQRHPAIRSYRGPAADGSYFVHPPNAIKGGRCEHALIFDSVERGPRVPERQAGSVDAAVLPGAEGLREWLGPRRGEDFIFVVVGMLVEPGRVRRALESLARQQVPPGTTWGVVVVWDGADHTLDSPGPGGGTEGGVCYADSCDATAYIQWLCCGGGIPGLDGRCTLLMPRVRRGGLANTVTAIRDVCSELLSVIILVDLDDSLVGDQVLLRLAARFRAGAEAVVGGMLRLGKAGSGRDGRPACAFNLKAPRAARGGCVWSHLRSFRRYLFLRVGDESLRGLDGAYYDVAWDWAMMLPVVEMAWRAECWDGDEVLYLYEPAGLDAPPRPAADVAAAVAAREAVIGDIVGKASYAKLAPTVAVVGYASFGHLSAELAREVDAAAEELGQLLATSGYSVVTGGMGGVMHSCARGMARAQGSVLSLLPSASRFANGPTPHAPALPTGLGVGRNAVVACADALVVVGGGAGTLDETARAWGNHRLIVVLRGMGGQEERLSAVITGGRDSGGCGPERYSASRLDHRLPLRDSVLAAGGGSDKDQGIQFADSPAEAVEILDRLLSLYRLEQVLWAAEHRPTDALQ